MKIDGLTHPKTKELAFTLGIPLPHAIGLLELMWAFVSQQTPQGNVGKWSNQVIAGEAGWQGDAEKFVAALISVGFLDENEEHRLVVHDWSDHAPNWVHAKLKKTGRRILSEDLRGDLRQAQETAHTATTSLAKPSQAKPSQAKSETRAPKRAPRQSKNQVSKPDEIDEQVWSDFLAHRRQKKSKLTPTAWAAIRKELETGQAKGHDPNDMLAEAMAAGWQGFKFEWYLNRLNGSKRQTESAVDRATREAIEYRERKQAAGR